MPSPRLVERLRADLLPGAAVDERDLRAHAVRCERVAEALVRAVAGRERARVLEVGIGSGYLVAAVRARLGDGVALYALEHPDRALPHDERFERFLRDRAVAFEAADLGSGAVEAFAGIDFDAILLSEVIEHLSPPRVPELFSELAARLAPGGALVVSSPNLTSFHRRLSLAAGRGRIFDLPLPLPEADGTFGHLRLYSRTEIEELLAPIGLRLEAWEYVDFEAEFVGNRGLRLAQRLLARAVPALASGWVAVARQRE